MASEEAQQNCDYFFSFTLINVGHKYINMLYDPPKETNKINDLD